MMSSTTVSKSLCSSLRNQAASGDTATTLAEDHDISVGTIRYHVYGECGHEAGPDSLTPAHPELPRDECREIRSRYAEGDSADDIATSLNHTWKTTVRHLTGECSHDGDALVVDKREVLQRMPVQEQDCASLRRDFHEDSDQDVLNFAQTVPWTYQTVVRHINGQCTHDINAPTRAIGERAHISETLCQEFRDRYSADNDLTLSNLDELAEEYEASTGTIQRHIRFRCAHDPESTLLDRIPGWEDLLDEDDIPEHVEDIDDAEAEPGTAERGTETGPDYSGIAAETGVHSPDSEEAVADLPQPDTTRVETTTTRIVRNTDRARELKATYESHCQLCGDARHRAPLEHYAEAHHIKPLGRPHEGPDTKSNMLVLCPNHHADLDHGLVHIDPETLEITHATDETVSVRELLCKDDHDINKAMLEYNNEEISKL
jgi:5-methylcytosine-specific restriction protein A